MTNTESFFEEIVFFCAITARFWLPIVMLLVGKKIILKIKSHKIKLVLMIGYSLLCAGLFLWWVRDL